MCAHCVTLAIQALAAGAGVFSLGVVGSALRGSLPAAAAIMLEREREQ